MVAESNDVPANLLHIMKRNKKGQFVSHRPLMRLFFGISLVYMVSMIGVNTIWGWAKSLEKNFVVENSQAVEVIQPTWQDEVKMMIRNAGLDVELATRLIQHESWWDYSNKHWNDAVYKNGKLVMPGHWDRGLWMFSKYYHPEISDDCAYDWHCSTVQAIRVIKSRGWQEWVAYRYVK